MLTIIDVSSVVYGGHYGSQRNMRGFPIGGLRKLLGLVNKDICSSKFALCFDGGEILKKELLPTYKHGRIPDYSVYAQIDMAKTLLDACNIPYLWEPKYEADDLIYSLCREMESLSPNEDIVIYTDDHDISCCVGEHVSIMPVTSQGTTIDMENYTTRVVRGKEIPYNSILLWKTFHGDPSDHYGALKVPSLDPDYVTDVFVNTVSSLITNNGLSRMAYADYDIFKIIVDSMFGAIPEEDKKALMDQARIAFPYRVPVSDCDIGQYQQDLASGDTLTESMLKHTKVFNSTVLNKSNYNFITGILGLNSRTRRAFDTESSEAQQFYEFMELSAQNLMDGQTAVRCADKEIIIPDVEIMDNEELPI